MTNGLNDARTLEHIQRIREVDAQLAEIYPGKIRVLPGIEVDILADGSLDLDDSTLAQMDIVVASIHSHFDQPIEQTTGSRSPRSRKPAHSNPRPSHWP